MIKAAGDGEVIFDGDGAYNLFNVMAANYNYFEGLTIRNTDLAFQGGLKNIAGSSGLTIKRCRFENVGRGDLHRLVGLEGLLHRRQRHDRPLQSELPDGLHRPHLAEPAGVQPEAVSRSMRSRSTAPGMSSRYNSIANFHDGVDVATYGNPDGTPNPLRDRLPVSIDFYGNDISNVEDNCIEADGGAHNIRIFRNRCFNHGHRALSVQPMFGGPVYFIRNVVYHAPEGGAVKFTASSSGIVVCHNTLIAPVKPMLLAASNVHYRNNLILGKSETLETFAVETNTNYSSSDYNGFRPNEGAEFSFEWSTPPRSLRANFPGEPGTLWRSGADEARGFVAGAAAVRDAEGIQRRNWSGRAQRPRGLRCLCQASPRRDLDPRTLYKPSDFDFQLRAGSVAVDAGVPVERDQRRFHRKGARSGRV